MSSKIYRYCAILAISLFMLPAFAFGQPDFAKAKQSKEKHVQALFGIDGVVAAGVSVDQNGAAIVKVFTNKANLQNVPVVLDGVNVEYVLSGDFVALNKPPQDKNKNKLGNVVAQRPGNGNGGGGGGGGGVSPTDRFARPVPIGVSLGSTGPIFCFAGTLGCRLKATSSGGVVQYILSNNHVVANENQGTTGSDGMLQPGTLDNNCVLDPADVIGVLSDFEPILFNGQPNLVDAGIAITDTLDTGFATPDGEAYGTPTANVQTATVGMRVVKYGRTTDFTYGKVDSVNVSVNVGYDSGTALFVNQIVIQGTRPNGRGSSTFSAGGDSGSLIVELADNDPVGLLFAGNSSFTIANPIGAVLDTFSGNGTTFTVDDGN